jgi:hypothetical protein
MVPAIWTFVNVLNESNFNRDARSFVNRELSALPHSDYLKKNAIYKYSDNGTSVIELNSFGLDEIPESSISLLQNRMNDYRALGETKLIFNQNRSKNIDNLKYMEELRSRDSLDLLSQTQKILFLEDKVNKLSKLERNYIAFEELTREVKINYENIEQFSYSNLISTNFTKMDTISVFSAKWYDSIANSTLIAKDKDKLERWLKVKLDLDTLVVRSLN